jgi:hypothetical protein
VIAEAGERLSRKGAEIVEFAVRDQSHIDLAPRRTARGSAEDFAGCAEDAASWVRAEVATATDEIRS